MTKISVKDALQYAHNAGFTGAESLVAVSIAYAESGGLQTDIKGPTLQGNDQHWGLAQFSTRWHPEAYHLNANGSPLPDSPAFDPQLAFNLMHATYLRTGFSEWETYNPGSGTPAYLQPLSNIIIPTYNTEHSQATNNAIKWNVAWTDLTALTHGSALKAGSYGTSPGLGLGGENGTIPSLGDVAGNAGNQTGVDPSNIISGVQRAVSSPLNAIENLFSWITDRTHLLRVGMVIGGAFLVFKAVSSIGEGGGQASSQTQEKSHHVEHAAERLAV